MAPIRGLLSSVIVALALASQRSVGKRGLEIETYNPPTSFETFGEGIPVPVDLRRDGSLESKARSFIAGRLASTAPTSNGVPVTSRAARSVPMFAKLTYKGIPFANAVANVAFKGESAVTFGSSFVKPKKIAATTPTVSVESVIPKIEAELNGKYNGHPTTVEYLARPDGTAALTHVIQIQNADENTWYEAFVDAHSGELLSITDFSAEAAYRVLPIQKQDLPEGLELLTNPHGHRRLSPGLALHLHWHDDDHRVPATTLSRTRARPPPLPRSPLPARSSTTPTTPLPLLPPPSTSTPLAPNAFYVINKLHDIAYRYGFTEAAFNFQNDNFGKGGSGNDRVLMSVQDSSGTNNANFATPPDGQSGTCRMYIWTLTTPNRDGSLNNDIIVHEMTHGITNRLTGGGTARCLQTTESRGMGEGWSDALAEWTEQKSADIKDFVLAPYVTNNVKGIRAYPYSTSATTNPLRYSNVRGNTAVHSIGTIWANVLHQVYAALVAQYGWSPAAFTNPSGAEGNIVFAHLFFDSLAIQPCNPTFTTGPCLIWKAFASRGVGVNAANYVDNFDVPAGC
ncbi:hypothetical protein FA13DRAFT_1789786 [Coprinellus micaceus]|uniref:Extracellular metalloproteinase n=1 Tax=Coprinellus micaceus TaxID=71717 RepID=A0A4Y7TIL8_COPMI|nr:hypothetical protein FA13DRAFT_1789786 [Coprinellus micaceus]